MLRLFNTLTRTKEVFTPLRDKQVGLYSCGPTVYHYAHMGNLRAFLFSDTLRRSLEFFGYKVKQVINITDVGHLVGDADEGEDKMAVAAKRERKTAWEVAAFYTKAFMADLKLLNIKKPSLMPRATDHIKEQIALVKVLEQKGFTYRASDGIYFDTAKFPAYGTLSGQRPEDRKAGARVEVSHGKKQPWDFALWKFSSKGQKRDMEWKSPWGIGFPGWHLECSVMSAKYLGQPFDIHTGGIDHIATHHEGEIAQSEAAYERPLANLWMHSEFLNMRGEKMAKSVGNIATLKELISRGYDPIAFRYLVLTAHYRSPLEFTFESLDAAASALQSLRDEVRSWDRPKIGCAEFEEKFRAALEDDLNTPRALAVVSALVRSDYPTHAKAKTLLEFDRVLGLNFKKYLGKTLKVPVTVQKLVAARERARASKDWARADSLRAQIAAAGYVVEDTSNGPKVRSAGVYPPATTRVVASRAGPPHAERPTRPTERRSFGRVKGRAT